MKKLYFTKMYKHIYLVNPSTQVKSILTCIQGMRIEDMVIMFL